MKWAGDPGIILINEDRRRLHATGRSKLLVMDGKHRDVYRTKRTDHIAVTTRPQNDKRCHHEFMYSMFADGKL